MFEKALTYLICMKNENILVYNVKKCIKESFVKFLIYLLIKSERKRKRIDLPQNHII